MIFKKTWSIVHRLAFMYAAATSGLFIIFIGYLYINFLYQVKQASEDFLKNELTIIRQIFEKDDKKLKALEQEIVWEPGTSQYHYYVRILNDKSRIMMETPYMRLLLPVHVFPIMPIEDKRPTKANEVVASNQHIYRIISQWMIINNKNYLIQVGLDITSDKKLIKDYQYYFLLVLLLSVFASIIVGMTVARRGLKSLLQMKRYVEKINPQGLSQRFELKQAPRELISLTEELNSMLERIETAFNRLQQFSADLAHEIRTPINNLMGETELALSRPRNNEEYQAILLSNLEEGRRLTQIIDGILFLARANRFNAEIKPIAIEVAKEFALLIEFYEPLAEEKQITLKTHGDAIVYAEPTLFRRALSNLLSNAINYSYLQGTIYLSVNINSRGATCIHVEDEGVGISAMHVDKIFDRFYRVDSARAKLSGGIGLGLAIVKSIMDMHGGEVRVQSETGKGTIFTLVFPAL